MTSTATRNVFEAVQRLTGAPWHHTLNPHSDRLYRYQDPCPTGYDTHTFGFYVSEDQEHWGCFGTCTTLGTAMDFYQLLTNQPMEYCQALARALGAQVGLDSPAAAPSPSGGHQVPLATPEAPTALGSHHTLEAVMGDSTNGWSVRP